MYNKRYPRFPACRTEVKKLSPQNTSINLAKLLEAATQGLQDAAHGTRQRESVHLAKMLSFSMKCKSLGIKHQGCVHRHGTETRLTLTLG